MNEAALGFRTHSGWSVMVAVTGSFRKPVVLDRRRIETADAAIRGSKQPYHAAERLEFAEAEALIRQCIESSTLLATNSVREMAAELGREGYTVSGAGIVFAAGRPLPELASILRSHALIHTAEGEFFRAALVRASESCALAVTRVKEREAWERAATLSRIDVGGIQQRVNELGRVLGPPWRQDESWRPWPHGSRLRPQPLLSPDGLEIPVGLRPGKLKQITSWDQRASSWQWPRVWQRDSPPSAHRLPS